MKEEKKRHANLDVSFCLVLRKENKRTIDNERKRTTERKKMLLLVFAPISIDRFIYI